MYAAGAVDHIDPHILFWTLLDNCPSLSIALFVSLPAVALASCLE